MENECHVLTGSSPFIYRCQTKNDLPTQPIVVDNHYAMCKLTGQRFYLFHTVSIFYVTPLLSHLEPLLLCRNESAVSRYETITPQSAGSNQRSCPRTSAVPDNDDVAAEMFGYLGSATTSLFLLRYISRIAQARSQGFYDTTYAPFPTSLIKEA